MKGKDLRSEHGRVGNPNELEAAVFCIISSNNKEPGAIRRSVNMGGLNGAVKLLFFSRQLIKVSFHCGSQGLYHIFEGIAISAAIQVKQKHGDFCIGQKLGIDISLLQVFCHRMVVGEVPIVDKGLVQADEGMGTAWVPYPTFCGIALMGNPDVGLEVIQFVVLHHLLRITHDLQNKEISTVR